MEVLTTSEMDRADRLTILRREGVWKDGEPLTGQAVDLLGGKIVTDLLQPGGIVAPQTNWQRNQIQASQEARGR